MYNSVYNSVYNLRDYKNIQIFAGLQTNLRVVLVQLVLQMPDLCTYYGAFPINCLVKISRNYCSDATDRMYNYSSDVTQYACFV